MYEAHSSFAPTSGSFLRPNRFYFVDLFCVPETRIPFYGTYIKWLYILELYVQEQEEVESSKVSHGRI
jgi:hypothetical protein